MAAAAAVLATLCALGAMVSCRRRTEEPARAAGPERAAKPPALPTWSGYSFRRGEKEAVEAFLREHRDLRMATDEDRHAEDPDDVSRLYGVYHPYFLRGDVNDDGVLDFVLAFVARESDEDSPWFSVVAFSGKEAGGFASGTFIERDVSLADGDVSVDRDSIVITPDLEQEDDVRRYRWDPIRRSYVFVHETDEEEDRLPAART